MNPNAFTHWYRLHEPKICLIAGATTMVGGAVLTGVQTVKATRKIDELKAKHEIEKFSPVDIFKLTWKYYIPPLLVLGGGIGLLCRGYFSSVAALESSAISYKYLKDGFELYKENVKEVVGDKKESEIRAKIADKKLEENPPPKEIDSGEKSPVGSNLIWCLDSFSGRYFKSNIDKLKAVEANLNSALILDDWVPLNELYYQIGLDAVKAGDRNGWSNKSGRGHITFKYDSTLVDGQPVLVLNYNVESEYFA